MYLQESECELGGVSFGLLLGRLYSQNTSKKKLRSIKKVRVQNCEVFFCKDAGGVIAKVNCLSELREVEKSVWVDHLLWTLISSPIKIPSKFHFIIKSIGHPKAIKLNINPNLITTRKKSYFLSKHLKCPNSTLESRGRINLWYFFMLFCSVV